MKASESYGKTKIPTSKWGGKDWRKKKAEALGDGFEMTKAGLVVEKKTYIDYLKESSFKESYKKFCIEYYLTHRMDEMREDADKKPPEGD